MVEHVQDGCLDELCLHDRSDDFEHGLAREDDRAFRNTPDITGKMESRKVIKEIILKNIETLQILNIVI